MTPTAALTGAGAGLCTLLHCAVILYCKVSYDIFRPNNATLPHQPPQPFQPCHPAAPKRPFRFLRCRAGKFCTARHLALHILVKNGRRLVPNADDGRSFTISSPALPTDVEELDALLAASAAAGAAAPPWSPIGNKAPHRGDLQVEIPVVCQSSRDSYSDNRGPGPLVVARTETAPQSM